MRGARFRRSRGPRSPGDHIHDSGALLFQTREPEVRKLAFEPQDFWPNPAGLGKDEGDPPADKAGRSDNVMGFPPGFSLFSEEQTGCFRDRDSVWTLGDVVHLVSSRRVGRRSGGGHGRGRRKRQRVSGPGRELQAWLTVSTNRKGRSSPRP